MVAWLQGSLGWDVRTSTGTLGGGTPRVVSLGLDCTTTKMPGVPGKRTSPARPALPPMPTYASHLCCVPPPSPSVSLSTSRLQCPPPMSRSAVHLHRLSHLWTYLHAFPGPPNNPLVCLPVQGSVCLCIHAFILWGSWHMGWSESLTMIASFPPSLVYHAAALCCCFPSPPLPPPGGGSAHAWHLQHPWVYCSWGIFCFSCACTSVGSGRLVLATYAL